MNPTMAVQDWPKGPRSSFPDEDFTYEQVFGHLRTALFTAQEAAEYLELSVADFRQCVQRQHIQPVRGQRFATGDLERLKRMLRATG